MKRIIIHWTAGIQYPNEHEKECYHFLIDALGKVHNGKFKPEDNENCVDGKYAQHTGGGNTGSIGVALCGMMGYKSKNNAGKYQITRLQFESAMQLCAKLALEYNIEVFPDTIMTHMEFGIKHPKSTSTGKRDIEFLPPFPWLEKQEIGKFIRSKIKWYLIQLNK